MQCAVEQDMLMFKEFRTIVRLNDINNTRKVITTKQTNPPPPTATKQFNNASRTCMLLSHVTDTAFVIS